MTINQTSSNFVVDDSFSSIKVTIYGNPKWGLFLPSLFVFLAQTFCILPILGLALLGIVQKNFSEAIQSIIMFAAFGLYLYILYKKLLEIAEYASTQEIVEIDNQSITVEKSGFLFFKVRKTFLAENIKAITASFYIQEQFNFLNRVPFASSSFGAFMIWQGRIFKPFYNFGNNVAQSDAELFLESVYRKFPKYRYAGTA
jgi:hypothetical protein